MFQLHLNKNAYYVAVENNSQVFFIIFTSSIRRLQNFLLEIEDKNNCQTAVVTKCLQMTKTSIPNYKLIFVDLNKIIKTTSLTKWMFSKTLKRMFFLLAMLIKFAQLNTNALNRFYFACSIWKLETSTFVGNRVSLAVKNKVHFVVVNSRVTGNCVIILLVDIVHERCTKQRFNLPCCQTGHIIRDGKKSEKLY